MTHARPTRLKEGSTPVILATGFRDSGVQHAGELQQLSAFVGGHTLGSGSGDMDMGIAQPNVLREDATCDVLVHEFIVVSFTHRLAAGIGIVFLCIVLEHQDARELQCSAASGFGGV